MAGDTAAAIASYSGPGATEIAEAAAAAPGFETVDYKAAFVKIDKDWGASPIWGTIRAYSPKFTSGYFLNAVDMQKSADGPQLRPENGRIYGTLFLRTLFMSVCTTNINQ